MPTKQHAPIAQMSSSQPPQESSQHLHSPTMGSSAAPWSQTPVPPDGLTKSSNAYDASSSMQPPAAHLSNSQESHSTDTSSSSNSFTRLPLYSRASLLETESTPPTSSDGPSDQSQEFRLRPFAYRSTAQQKPLDSARPRTPPAYADTSDPTPRLELHSTPVSPASTNARYGGLVQGQKRTANGELKPGTASLPGSPINAGAPGHSRNLSIDSGGSNISELSSQLRARLSYAMVKVQNGWQGRSLDEVENLTSPTSSTFTPQGPLRSALRSPPALPASLRREESDVSQNSSDTSSPSKKQSLSRDHFRNHNSDLSPNFTLSPPSRYPTAGSLTYESFWQNHATPNPVSQYLQTRATTTTNHSNSVPSLAPAAPIEARPHPRRSNSRTIQPTMLSALTTSNNHKVSDLSETSTIPNTPPPSSQPRTPVMRTPSQKTAMEKDAVETLLFMSSPGNSSYHPPREMPGTPLRAATKKVEFVDGVGTSSDDEDIIVTNSNKQLLFHGDDMDRMLDGMAEDDSSDDEEIEVLAQRNHGYRHGPR